MMLLLTFAFSYVPWKKWYPLNKSLISLDSVSPYLGDITIPTGISTKDVAEQLKGKIADRT